MNAARFEAAKDLCGIAHLRMGPLDTADYTADEVFSAKLLLGRLLALTAATFTPTDSDRALLGTLAEKTSHLIEAGVLTGGAPELGRIAQRLLEVAAGVTEPHDAWLEPEAVA